MQDYLQKYHYSIRDFENIINTFNSLRLFYFRDNFWESEDGVGVGVGLGLAVVLLCLLLFVTCPFELTKLQYIFAGLHETESHVVDVLRECIACVSFVFVL